MNFSDIYKNQFRYSVEVFPPKTEEGVKNLIKTLHKLEAISPAYVSVTYGAMGSTRDLTKDLAFRIYDEIKSHTAFHFTCVGSGRQEILKYVEVLSTKGINLILALRGDIPKDQTEFIPPEDGFGYANELVSFLKEKNNLSVAVAGYPEKHPEAPSLETDIENLKRKVDAGAEVIITQLFFENPIFYKWLDKVRQAGITVPVIPGIMPILKLSQIKRITELSGARLPKDLLDKLAACKEDETAMPDVGIEIAAKQCRDLKENGVPGIHFYCMNKAYSVLKIVETLGLCFDSNRKCPT